MRVLLWSETFWPQMGGVQVFGVKLFPALRDRGHEFLVITRQDYRDLPPEAHYKGIQICRFPFWKALAKGNMELFADTRQRIGALKRAFSPDLVHIYSFGSSVLFHLKTQAAQPIPSLVTIHEAWPDSALEPNALLTQTLRSATWVTGVSDSALAKPRSRVPEIRCCSSIIYNGLDVASFYPGSLAMERLNLVCIGRLVREKGFDLAVKALRLVSDRFPGIRLAVAGDGPARVELEELSNSLKVSDRVDFLGWIPPEKIPTLLNSATVVLMPSRTEALGLVGLEAALMARPVVATRVGGLPEIVLHEKTGLLVESEDVSSLMQAIAFLLNHPDRARQMGEAARRRAEKVFSLERCVDSYDVLYRRLAKGSSRAECA